jgi:small subunit ribosomal protein S16
MLKIKMARFGKKKQPTYRLIINEAGRDTYGKALENLGNYDPRSKKLDVKADRVKYWISVGAQLTDSVNNLLIANKVIEGKMLTVSKLTKKIRAKTAAELAAKKAAEVAAAAEAAKPAEVAPEATVASEAEVPAEVAAE